MNDETKSIRIDENFQVALKAVKKERGTPIRFTVHVAIREHFERYYPEYLPLITGVKVEGDEVTE